MAAPADEPDESDPEFVSRSERHWPPTSTDFLANAVCYTQESKDHFNCAITPWENAKEACTRFYGTYYNVPVFVHPTDQEGDWCAEGAVGQIVDYYQMLGYRNTTYNGLLVNNSSICTDMCKDKCKGIDRAYLNHWFHSPGGGTNDYCYCSCSTRHTSFAGDARQYAGDGTDGFVYTTW